MNTDGSLRLTAVLCLFLAFNFGQSPHVVLCCRNVSYSERIMELAGKRIAIFAESQFEDLELWYPALRLREAGAVVTIVGTGTADTYHGKHGVPVLVDEDAEEVSASGIRRGGDSRWLCSGQAAPVSVRAGYRATDLRAGEGRGLHLPRRLGARLRRDRRTASASPRPSPSKTTW